MVLFLLETLMVDGKQGSNPCKLSSSSLNIKKDTRGVSVEINISHNRGRIQGWVSGFEPLSPSPPKNCLTRKNVAKCILKILDGFFKVFCVTSERKFWTHPCSQPVTLKLQPKDYQCVGRQAYLSLKYRFC